MSNKQFKGRIQHKHDTEANWLKAANFSPLSGELIIYDVDENTSFPRIKVGDGSTNVNSLPFLSSSSAISASIVVDCSTWSGSSFVVSNTFFNNITDSDTVIVAPAPEDLVFAAEYGIYVNSISSGQATLYRTNTSAWQSSTLTLNFLVIKGN